MIFLASSSSEGSAILFVLLAIWILYLLGELKKARAREKALDIKRTEDVLRLIDTLVKTDASISDLSTKVSTLDTQIRSIPSNERILKWVEAIDTSVKLQIEAIERSEKLVLDEASKIRKFSQGMEAKLSSLSTGLADLLQAMKKRGW